MARGQPSIEWYGISIETIQKIRRGLDGRDLILICNTKPTQGREQMKGDM